MSKGICCGSCKHFKFEDAEGYGYCELIDTVRSGDWVCPNHNILKRKARKRNYKEDDCEEVDSGWAEITPDNMDKVYNIQVNRLVIAWEQGGMTVCRMLQDISPTISTMAKIGGYYYMELPELKIG